MVAPDKQTIYGEQLPDWLKKEHHGETKLDQFLAHMRPHSTVKVLDLRPALKNECRFAPTYFRTDTHWNLFGGFVACEEMARCLCEELPGVEPLSLNSFEVKDKLDRGGDLVDMLGLDGREVTEENAVCLTPKSRLPALETSGTITRNRAGKGGAIVYHDSFGQALKPFLGYHFGSVNYRQQQNLDAELAASGTTVVISEMVERKFNVLSPSKLMSEDALK